MKAFKRIVCLFCILLCLFGLSGCDIVGQLEKSHAMYKQKGDNTLITYAGKDYRLFGYPGDNTDMFDVSSQVFVADPDVPLLLIEMFGKEGYLNANQTVISMENGDWYVLDEIYDSFCDELENSVSFSGLGYDSWIANEDDDVEYEFIRLTSEQNAQMTELLNSEPVNKYEFFQSHPEYVYVESVCALSESEVFKIVIGEIVKQNGEYLFVANSLERDKFLGKKDAKYGWMYEYELTGELLSLAKKIDANTNK